MSQDGDTPPHVVEESEEIVEEEDLYSEENDEVILSHQEPITRRDIRELIKNWEDKFEKMTEGVRTLEISTHDVHTHLDTVTRESRARESALTSTNRHIDSIKEALTRFMEAYSTNHVYLHRPNVFGFWQMRLHLCYETLKCISNFS